MRSFLLGNRTPAPNVPGTFIHALTRLWGTRVRGCAARCAAAATPSRTWRLIILGLRPYFRGVAQKALLAVSGGAERLWENSTEKFCQKNL
jgi:hypothetical protein